MWRALPCRVTFLACRDPIPIVPRMELTQDGVRCAGFSIECQCSICCGACLLITGFGQYEPPGTHVPLRDCELLLGGHKMWVKIECLFEVGDGLLHPGSIELLACMQSSKEAFVRFEAIRCPS